MTEYLASPFRERTRTHRSHPSELSSCSAARCSRSRSARRRSSRSDSDNRRRDFVAMMAPSDEGPPAAGRCRPNAPRRGAKSGGRSAAARDHARAAHVRRHRAAMRDTARTTPATGSTKTNAPRPASDVSPGLCSDRPGVSGPRRWNAPIRATSAARIWWPPLFRKQSRCGEARASTGWLLCCAGDSVPARWVANFRILGREQ